MFQAKLAEARNDVRLDEQLIYDQGNDKCWKPRASTDPWDKTLGSKPPANTAGWVVPLMRVCKKVGIDPGFFADNPDVDLIQARCVVLNRRLMTVPQLPKSVAAFLPRQAYKNEELTEFFAKQWNPSAMQKRMLLYNQHFGHVRGDLLQLDREFRVGIFVGMQKAATASSYPNHMQLEEQRFTIGAKLIDGIFNHKISDKYPLKCRSSLIPCRDETRVLLEYKRERYGDFIHANHVEGPPIFNSWLLTQAPMSSTIGDFWRMVWQFRVPYIFMLISRKQPDRCFRYWPRNHNEVIYADGLEIRHVGVDEFRDPLFRVTQLMVRETEKENIGPLRSKPKTLRVEHWQGDMNNSENVQTPLNLLQMARSCGRPVVVHDHLGVSRAAAFVAIDFVISSLLRGPYDPKLVTRAIQFVRERRPYAVETPIQAIWIHRVVQQFIRPIAGEPPAFHAHYHSWLAQRALRMPIDRLSANDIPIHRQLSPPFDPDCSRFYRQSLMPPKEPVFDLDERKAEQQKPGVIRQLINPTDNIAHRLNLLKVKEDSIGNAGEKEDGSSTIDVEPELERKPKAELARKCPPRAPFPEIPTRANRFLF